MSIVITIDGPSGSGKGTVSREIAALLGFDMLDSGALYRLAALAALNANVDMQDETRLALIARDMDVHFSTDSKQPKVWLDNNDVSTAIREEKTGMLASKIAALPTLRAALLARQRAFATARGLVADGRDMGTLVFPDAAHKFFLTASAEERARRRVAQLQGAGVQQVDAQQILADIVARDKRDTDRPIAPLVPAADATIIDSTEMDVAAVVATILRQVQSEPEVL